MTDTDQRERRWIILGDDGRHVTLGRRSDPSEEELTRASDALSAAGQGGWLAVTEGVYYSRGALTVMMVRELAPARSSWESALASFHDSRRRATAPQARRKAPGPG